jgi:hypothetical protein
MRDSGAGGQSLKVRRRVARYLPCELVCQTTLAVDDSIRCLEVESRGARVGREEQAACRITLKLVDQLMPLFLRHGAIEPNVVEVEALDPGLDEREHCRPFGEQHDLARFLRAWSSSRARVCPPGRCCPHSCARVAAPRIQVNTVKGNSLRANSNNSDVRSDFAIEAALVHAQVARCIP